MRSGTKHLRIASVLQIVLGIAYIIFMQFLVKNGDFSNTDGEKALFKVMLSYGGAAFQIVAGLLGLLLANKKSIITVILGILLFIPQLVAFINVKDNIVLIIINAVLLAIPYYYLHNAWKNFKKEN